MARTDDDTPPPVRIANLVIIWRFVARYKGHVACALLALLVAAGGTQFYVEILARPGQRLARPAKTGDAGTEGTSTPAA